MLDLQAIILLGGKGTRLAATHPDLPKALVPLAGKPFLQWQIDWMENQGIHRFHLAAGHLSDQIVAWVKQQPDSGISITVSIEPDPRGTAGGIKFCEEHIQSDPFLIINGDTILPRLPFTPLFDHHRSKQASITIAAVQVDDAGRFGTMDIDQEDTITGFHEKGRSNEGWVNGGVYLAGQSLLSSIPVDTSISIETDLFPPLASAGQLAAFRSSGPLLDMGTPEGLEKMQGYLKESGTGN